MAKKTKRAKRAQRAQRKRKVQKTAPRAPRPKPKTPDIFEGVYKPKMRVVGVGGGGSNIVAQIAQTVRKLDFVAANTDLQALRGVSRKNVKTFSFGEKLTKGLGCGMDALLGESAAQGDKEKLVKLLQGQDLLILVSSLGGGTGSGASPVFLQIAKEQKCLAIGIFTLPFSFEGEKRKQLALAALEKVKPLVNAYVLISNDNIFRVIDRNASFQAALSSLNKRLGETLEGFVETLSLPGFINIDFADVQSLVEGRGRLAYLASSITSGQDRAVKLVEQLLANPLLDYSSRNAERVLLNIAGGKDLTMQEVATVSKATSQQSLRAKVIFGITLGNTFEKKMRATLFALGVSKEDRKPQELQRAKARVLPKQKKRVRPAKQARLPMPKPAPERAAAQPRRNALELQKAIEEEIQEIQEQEKAWDRPAFLRAKRA